MSVPYKWLEQTDSDLKQFKECFDENESPKSLEHLTWQYFNAPLNSPPIAALGLADPANTNGKLSAIYAIFKTEFICEGQTIRVCQSLDTLTSSAFRRQGLFNKLATLVYESSRQQGLGFVYGFPNGISGPGLFNKLGWTELTPVPFLILPLNLRYIASKLPIINKLSAYLPEIRLYPKQISPMPDCKIIQNVPYDNLYEELWHSFRQNINLGINRSSQFMNWRLVEKPDATYQNFACFNATGKMLAICIYTAKNKHGGKVGYVMELLHLSENQSEAKLVLRNALADMAQSKCDAILAWNLKHSQNHSVFKKSGFYYLPESIRPIELHFGYRAFDPALDKVLAKPANWYISYLDSDTV